MSKCKKSVENFSSLYQIYTPALVQNHQLKVNHHARVKCLINSSTHCKEIHLLSMEHSYWLSLVQCVNPISRSSIVTCPICCSRGYISDKCWNNIRNTNDFILNNHCQHPKWCLPLSITIITDRCNQTSAQISSRVKDPQKQGKREQGPLLVTWFNYNPSMDK